MSLREIITGRSDKEADVYENPDKVATVIEHINEIGSVKIESAKSAISEAISAYNSVNGVAEFVGTLDSGAVTGYIDEIGSGIKELGNQIQSKADDIKIYQEASYGEKVLSSATMWLAKTGEGFLSVFEGLGDGVASVLGWIAPADSQFEQDCKNFIQKNWSHDVFNSYYNSDFAKKSNVTEDGLLAKADKFVGSMAGYSALGLGLTFLGGATQGAGTASKIFEVIAGTPKRIGVTEAIISGMGYGTDRALNSNPNISMDSAALRGVTQAGISGVAAYGVGTLLEHIFNPSSSTLSEMAPNQGALAGGSYGLGSSPNFPALAGAGDSSTALTVIGRNSSGTPALAGQLFQSQVAGITAGSSQATLALPETVSGSTGEATPLFRTQVSSAIQERFNALDGMVSDATRQSYNQSLVPSFSDRSRLELLADKAIKSGDYAANPEVKKLVDGVVGENVSLYLGGSDDALSRRINQYIIDNDVVGQTVGSIPDLPTSRTVQNIVEDRVTDMIIQSSDYPQDAGQLARNISDSVDKGPFNWDYTHIITYNAAQGQSGGYHKVGSASYCADGSLATQYLPDNAKPIKTNLLSTEGAHEPITYETVDKETGALKTEPVTKNIYPGNYTHQQIADVAVSVGQNGEKVDNAGRETIKMRGDIVTGEGKYEQQTILSPDGQSIVSVFINKIKMNNTMKKNLLRYKE